MFGWLKRYAEFDGRASRKEFWLGVLGYLVVFLAAGFADELLFRGDPLLTGVVWLGMFVPITALAVRRLHDLDYNGWVVVLGVFPLINLLLFYWWAQPGQPHANSFGPPPPETPGLTGEPPPAASPA